MHINGSGGRSVDQHPFLAHSIKLGAIEWENLAVMTASMVRPVQENDPATLAGLLGADVMS